MEGTRQSSTEQQPFRASDVDQNMPATVDTLSNLGNELLCHILSFVPTKLSVSTSILAKRWRFIWAHVPVLDLSEPDSLRWPMSTIINKVMLLHRMRSLDTLRLTYSEYTEEDYNELEFETWIATAIERNVRNLDLCTKKLIGSFESFVWPLSLFTCKTLVHLKLIESTLPRFSGPVSLPSLKKFWFQHVDFLADEAIPHLLLGCPVLDEFTFEWYDLDWEDHSCVAIRRLAAYNYSRRMEIVADKFDMELVYYVALNISASMITSLDEAKVKICVYGELGNLDREIVVLMRLLDVLCHVKCLTLSLYLVCSSEIQLFPRFDNCTRLELAVDLAFLVKFLESADNLEVLITRNIPRYLDDLENWTEPKQVPTCLLSSLKTVRIEEYECTAPELEMAKYLMKNAKVLKRMEIHFSNDEDGVKKARLDASPPIVELRSEAFFDLVIY